MLEGADRAEPSCAVGGDVKWCRHMEESVWRSLRWLVIEPLHGPAVPPGPHSTQKSVHGCSSSVLLVSRNWKQPKCLSAGDGQTQCGPSTQQDVIQP